MPKNQTEDRQMKTHALPIHPRQLAQESASLADLCQYLSQQKMDVPPDTLDRIEQLPRLDIAERICALSEINQALMEYINRVGKGSQIRQ